MKRHSRWKGRSTLGVVLVGIISALPNLFGNDPALQVIRADGQPVSERTLSRIELVLQEASIAYKTVENDDGVVLIRFNDLAAQRTGSETLSQSLDLHIVALTLASRTPGWLKALHLEPMRLGHELRSVVELLYEVDLEATVQRALESLVRELQAQFTKRQLSATARLVGDAVRVQISLLEEREAVVEVINDLNDARATPAAPGLPERLAVEETTIDGQLIYEIRLSEAQIGAREDAAVQRNTTMLGNWLSAFGVADVVVQRQGRNRIAVQFWGVQDPARIQRSLRRRATLEFRLVDTDHDALQAQRTGRVPSGAVLRERRDGTPVLLEREIIASGDEITEARASRFLGGPAVFVSLNDVGARRMLEATQANLNRPLAVLFVEEKPELVQRDGNQVLRRTREERVIDTPNIHDPVSRDLWITGMTRFETQDMALLLRGGALAPMVKAGERMIGPSLERDTIKAGRNVLALAFSILIVVMVVRYRGFGVVAGLALLVNLILIVGLLSVLRTSLTLPGIAGVVLSVALALSANVVIIERIRGELANGNSPLASIRAGYKKTFATMAAVTAAILAVSVVLLLVATPPVKAFGITLSVGSVTAMFTAFAIAQTIINVVPHSWRARAALSALPLARSERP